MLDPTQLISLVCTKQPERPQGDVDRAFTEALCDAARSVLGEGAPLVIEDNRVCLKVLLADTPQDPTQEIPVSKINNTSFGPDLLDGDELLFTLTDGASQSLEQITHALGPWFGDFDWSGLEAKAEERYRELLLSYFPKLTRRRKLDLDSLIKALSSL